MSQQTINVGTAANNGTGDPLRDACVKIQANFADLYLRMNFSSSLTPTTLLTSQDNYSPAGYTAGVTSRMILTAASGGSTINGLIAAPDGFTILLINNSTTDGIIFTHHTSSIPANQFSCSQGASAELLPLSNTLIMYVVNQWIFLS